MLSHDAATTPSETHHLLAPSHNTSQHEHPTPPALPPDRDTLPETATTGRTISWTSAYILIISRVIGSGIFSSPGPVAISAGSIGLSLLIWLAGAFIAACALVVSMEFGCMLPRSGGEKVYLEFIYRQPRFLISSVVAVKAVLQAFTANNSIVFAEYLLFGLGVEEPTGFARKGVAVGFLVVVVVVHGCFLRTGIWVQNVLGWFKVGLMCFMVLTALFVVVFRRPEGGVRESAGVGSWEGLWEGSNWSWGVVSLGVFKVYNAYAGYDNANNVLNEVKNPIGTLKTVGPAALASVCVLYLLINAAYFVIVPLEEVKHSGELIAGLFFDKLFGPGFGRNILPLFISLCVAGNVMVGAFSYSRLNQELSRSSLLPFSHILSSSRPFGAPLGGLIILFISNLLIIVLPPPGDIYSFILNAEGYIGQFFALALALGLLLLRRRRPDLRRPFRAWIPAVGVRIAVCVGLIAAPVVGRGKGEFGLWTGTYALVGVGILGLGVGYWVVWAVVMPRLGGYRLEERGEVLLDGTKITAIVKVKDE